MAGLGAVLELVLNGRWRGISGCVWVESGRGGTCTSDTDTDRRSEQNPALMPTAGDGQGQRSTAQLRRCEREPRALSTNQPPNRPTQINPNKYTTTRPFIHYTNFQFQSQFQFPHQFQKSAKKQSDSHSCEQHHPPFAPPMLLAASSEPVS